MLKDISRLIRRYNAYLAGAKVLLTVVDGRHKSWLCHPFAIQSCLRELDWRGSV